MSDENEHRSLIRTEGSEHAGGISRWIPAAVVLTALGGFVSLAWYAYNVGTQSVNEDSILVVEADKTPIKEKPEDPGGMQFPNQDKVIFETISGNGDTPPKVERILPAPEEPITSAGGETTTWVNDKIAQNAAEEEAVADKDDSAIPTESKVEVKQEFVREVAVDKKPAPAKAAASDIASFTQEKKPQPEPKEKPAEALDKAVKAPPKVVGKAKAQLGAYGSEVEAKAAWNTIKSKFGSVFSGHDYVVVRADLGPKGIFYRLRVTGFSDTTDAKKFCGTLSAKKQACIPVAE